MLILSSAFRMSSIIILITYDGYRINGISFISSYYTRHNFRKVRIKYFQEREFLYISQKNYRTLKLHFLKLSRILAYE